MNLHWQTTQTSTSASPFWSCKWHGHVITCRSSYFVQTPAKWKPYLQNKCFVRFQSKVMDALFLTDKRACQSNFIFLSNIITDITNKECYLTLWYILKIFNILNDDKCFWGAASNIWCCQDPIDRHMYVHHPFFP